MRIKLLVVGLLTWALLGAACSPEIDGITTGTNNSNAAKPATSLALTLDRPIADRAVPVGSVVEIQYMATNTTGESAALTILVEQRVTLTRTTLLDAQSVSGVGRAVRLSWDTTGFEGGPYSIRGLLVSGGQTRESNAPGRIAIDPPPDVKFTSPAVDTTFVVDTTIKIGFSVRDLLGSGKVRVGFDTDSDHGSGNEIFLVERPITTDTFRGEIFDFGGKDIDGDDVPVGTYNLFALAEDNVNPLQTIEGLARITVPEPPEPPEEPEPEPVLGVRTPSTDVEFIRFQPALKIEYGINKTTDVLIDLKVDVDDNHANGNEITILAQKFIAARTKTAEFDWDGTDTSGVVVPDGIYTLLVVSSTGTGTPQTVPSTHFIRRRTSTPLIESQQTWERAGIAWTLITPPATPVARRDVALAYDNVANLTLLFGGALNDTPNAETWVYNRSTWQMKDVPGPSRRFGHAMAFDDDLGEVVLFGGTDGTTLSGETWNWNGSEWTQQMITGPSARFGHALAYDSERAVLVLFGGFDGTSYSNETWEYDGDTWVLTSPPISPSARRNCAMAYDKTRGVTILFGGEGDNGLNDETWEWDGDTWFVRDPSARPTPRSRHALAFDESRDRVVLFGGTGLSASNDESWEWDGDTWKKADPALAPAAREGFGLAYDRQARRVVLFGGNSGVPVISVLEPATPQTVSAGNFVTIKWRDDDPAGRSGVRVTLDDDATPGETTETGQAEIEILNGRQAGPDGVQDTFQWQVPASLAPGTYHVFTYIDRTGEAPYDSLGVSPGMLIIRDPANP